MSDQVTSTDNKTGRQHRIGDMQSSEALSIEDLDRLGIIHPRMDNRAMLNSYRDIRNKLLKLSDYNNFVCLVSSLSARDETFLQALNLAAVFAFDKSRSAIIVDCTAEDEVINELIATDEHMGLIDFIEADYDDLSALLYESRLERVRVIPTGRKSETRTETLESTRMREIIIELKHRYPDRFIFVNAPNMTTSSEVQVLANISDMVVFEMTPGSASVAEVQEAVEMVGPEKVAGVLFQEG